MKSEKRSPLLVAVLAVTALFVVFIAVLGAYRLISGKSIGLRSLVGNWVNIATNPVKNVINGREMVGTNQGNYSNIIFLHHSTGNNLVQQGGVRDMFLQNGYAFWDHGYNQQGLRDPQGKTLGFNYKVPNDNTDPDGLVTIFQQDVLPLPLNTLTSLLQHEVVVLKSCFRPGNKIRSEEQLEEYKKGYLEMRDVMVQHPDRLFIVMTTPPLNPAETNAEEAGRARLYSEWLQSEEFVDGAQNIIVFDFYNLLAESDPGAADYNMLREEYRDGADSHPNQTANEAIGPLFADFVLQSIETHRDNYEN